MKNLAELGISPTPWRVNLCGFGAQDRVKEIEDANGETIVETDYGMYPPKLPDARMLVAAPKLYAACYEMLRYYYEQDTNTTVFYTALGLMKQAVAEAAGEVKPVEYQPNSGGYLARVAGEITGKVEVPNVR